MENVMTKGFAELSASEMNEVEGGGVTAAIYALGFVFGCSPLGAICICVGVTAAAVGAGVLVSKYL
ncbi:hypothetical protein [uncultured Ruminococcus sp.]|uniref:hypothetical protein n=1 Tax=uncultured Ruminococcus sp. TaxID=165186 RepID=UPI0025D8938A|nr:hypothetical protein [uncultured Ruminococcus sp.]